jgi:hypothetical protein
VIADDSLGAWEALTYKAIYERHVCDAIKLRLTDWFSDERAITVYRHNKRVDE